MQDLSGKVAVVTGAGGIGKGLAMALADDGMRLTVADIDADGLRATGAELRGFGAEAVEVVTDATRPPSKPSPRRRWTPSAACNTLNDLGRMQYITGDHAGATRVHEQALTLSEQFGNPFGQANALNSLGRVRQVTGDYAGATRAYEQALTVYEQLGSRIGQANALDGLGECPRCEGFGEEAAGFLRQALMIYQDLGAPYAENVAARLARLGLENTDSPK